MKRREPRTWVSVVPALRHMRLLRRFQGKGIRWRAIRWIIPNTHADGTNSACFVVTTSHATKGRSMHKTKTLSWALLFSWTAFACHRNVPTESKQDAFPNSNTTVPAGDTGFQEGTFAHPESDDRMRFEGKAAEESPCPETVRPGDDQGSIDERCPDADIKPLVPLSSPTPSEIARPVP